MKPSRPFVISATNFSSHASAAATVAAKLALRHSGTLMLVHATEATGAGVLATLHDRLVAEAQRLQATGVVVDHVLLEGGRPAEALIGLIREKSPSLVVVSAGMKGPMDRWALGSFSERIAESSPVPTLVVRNAGAFDAWDWTQERLTVVLALDLYATSDVVLRWAKEFRLAGPCDLVSCYVNRRMPTIEEAAVAPGRPVNPPTLQSRLERELQKKVRDQIGDDVSPVIVRPHFGDPGPCLVEIATEVKAQLIAVGTHQRHGLSRLTQFSVSRELLRQSGMNVVCVPVSATFDPREAHLPDFRRVLVTTDFSELGNAAVPVACAACSIGGLVKIIHVAPPPVRGAKRVTGGGDPDLAEQLRLLIPFETGARCQPPIVEVIEGHDVAAAVCEEAERFGADIVCLSSHGLGASHALHGSVTKAVLKKLRRPLLVVRRSDE
ncbi:universal stress protein [Horticoccus sp. 23ND18S-11]|uniref:universal stress protein n=1 Tax=Horticoccus sp. 23ND18S-11 TaxID=3391832 RepID=UPI0039C8C4A3